MAGTHTLPHGAHYNWFVNRTGSASVKGTLVQVSTDEDNAVTLSGADGFMPIGVIYDTGIADGTLVRVVTGGKAQVLLEDSTAATRAYWVRTSENDAGRVDATNNAPPGGTIQALNAHSQEVGHSLETITAGTDELCWVLLHFN